MPDYCFFQKDKQIIVLERTDVNNASQLLEQGFEKQFEEVSAMNEESALTRFADIRKNNQIDRSNFLAGAGTMPLIGVLRAAATALFQKK
ncbi:hypothetical protein HV318_01750 [Enterobacter sp. RHBSTW-00901]|uniref:Uncharacterized protein n=1 Tax=Enterobacter mori TaxID=539813 RepID=A0A7T0DZN6_9ENTR|nr:MULTISPECIES: hypothetical protein [Enterobacter]MBA7853777.1 hypothetical protein [Enterobacter sp. RHBSTW-00901]QPK02429.1 hypothetical protein IDM36_10120 [Enterobacter mori]